jgi:hypothetical protein
MTPNTTPEKPEWFELAEDAAPAPEIKKVSKKLPAIAVLITGAVIATGAFFANASEGKVVDDQASFGAVDPSQNSLPKGFPPALGDTSTALGDTSTVPGINPPHRNFDDGDGHDGGGNNGTLQIPSATSSPAAKGA